MRFDFPDGELGLAASLGAVTDRSVRIWLRDPSLAAHEATLSVDGEVAARARLQPATDHDGIAAADLALDRSRPDAAFTVQVAGLTRAGWLAPALGTPAALTFAFGSCHQPFATAPDGRIVKHAGVGMYPRMARVLASARARLLLLLGDQVYSDGLEPTCVPRALRREWARGRPLPPEQELHALYRHLYRGYFNEPGFRRLVEGQPTCFMWDDHDIFDGWGSLLRVDALDCALARSAAAVFREYQHLHNPGATLDAAAPHHFPLWHGDVGFFVLDLRSERDYCAGRLLGERQWRALTDFLREASDRGVCTVFVGSTIPVVHLAPAPLRPLERLPVSPGPDVRDRWSVRPLRAERDALLDLLFAWQAARGARQVVILSGDVHAGAAFEVRPRAGAGLLHQWTSSALSTPPEPLMGAMNRLGTALVNWGEWHCRVSQRALVLQNNFGMVAVTPLASGGHRIELRLWAYDRQRQRLGLAARLAAQPGTGA